MSNVDDQIQNELSSMSTDELRQALLELVAKQNDRKKYYNTPEAKARRKQYYEDKKNTPEWKAARKVQADKRKAKVDALIAMAKARGIDLKELGF